jgi:hypothetical protein
VFETQERHPPVSSHPTYAVARISNIVIENLPAGLVSSAGSVLLQFKSPDPFNPIFQRCVPSLSWQNVSFCHLSRACLGKMRQFHSCMPSAHVIFQCAVFVFVSGTFWNAQGGGEAGCLAQGGMHP